MSFPIEQIKCDKVYLRNISTTDIQSVYEIYSDPEVTKFLDFPAMNDLSHAENFIDNVLLGYLNGDLLEWAIIEKRNDLLIGTIRFEQWDNQHDHAQIGFGLKRKWWGKGLMSNLLPSFIRFGFRELELNRIQANIHSSNIRCIKLFKMNGFQREGLLRERYIINGQPNNIVIFSLLKNDTYPVV